MSNEALPDRTSLDALRGGLPSPQPRDDRPVIVISPWWPLDFVEIRPKPRPRSNRAAIALVTLILVATGLGLWMAVT